MNHTIIFCDFDGTIFDSDKRMLLAAWYDRRSAHILDRDDTFFVVTTGRHSWGPWTRLNYALTGMRRPNAIVAGAGTKIYWDRNGTYLADAAWRTKMTQAFDKSTIQSHLAPFLTTNILKEYAVPNDHMIVVTVYGKTPAEAVVLQEKIAEHLGKYQVKVILSEQLFFKNTPNLFNGYALIVPAIAGKENSALHILEQYEKTQKKTVTMMAFGDASIDIPLLTMDKPASIAQYQSYGVHMTPLAREMVKNLKKGTTPTLLEGSAPRSIYRTLRTYYQQPRNSPFRDLISPFEWLIDMVVHPRLTPNELTARGLQDVRRGLAQKGFLGFLITAKGHALDAVDGIRARRHPEQKTADGQLLDVYADRVKEFEGLMARNQPEAALTCTLPSIARAQAEAMGSTVPELDQAGGSALTRTRRLLTSLFFFTIGQTKRSEALDHQIEQSNLATFTHRRHVAKSFSWDISHLKKYDRSSVERLLLLIDLLQTQYAEVSKKQKLLIPQLKEYLGVKVKPIRAQLKIPEPKIVE